MDSDQKKYDVLILGVGHQSLICANYLSKNGFKTCILDAPSPMSGATPYAEFHEGLKTGPCAHTPIPVSSRVVSDLELEKHGFEMRNMNATIFVPSEEDKFLFASKDVAETRKTLSKISEQDAEKFFALHEKLHRLAQMFAQLDTNMPEYTQSGWKDIWAVFETARHLSDEHKDLQELFTQLMKMSLSDFLNQHFKTDLIKGMISFHATLGSMANPAKEGSAVCLALFILSMGETSLYNNEWQPLRGSLQPYFRALTKAALENNVTFDTATTVKSIKIENKRFKELETDNGTYASPILIGDASPQILFLDLIDQNELSPDFKMRLDSFGGVNGFIRVKLALKELPKFTCLGEEKPEKYLGGEITISPSLDYMQTAFTQTLAEGGSQRPSVSMVIPSLTDPEFGADGLHTCSLLGQYFEPNLPDTQENQIAVSKALVSAINEFAPNFRDSVVTFLPVMGEALDKTIGPLNTDLTGGGLPLLKMLNRQLPHHALMSDIPIEGIYMCGYGPESSANPHVIDIGQQLAGYIIQNRKPAAAA